MKCPNCGKEVTTPIKEWDLSPKVHVKLYECNGYGCCGESFREYVKAEQKSLHELYKKQKSLHELYKKQNNLGEQFRNLKQKIEELESSLKIKREVSIPKVDREILSPRLSETSDGPWIWSRKRKV